MDEDSERTAQPANPDAAAAAAEEETAAARRLVHELTAGGVDRQVLFRLYVAGEDAERIRSELGLDADHFDRILSRAKQRFKEILHRDHPELEAGLRRGLTLVAAREAAGEIVVREGLRAWLSSPVATRVLIGVLLAAVATAGLLEVRTHRLRRALDSARIASPPRQTAPAAVLETQLLAARRALDDERLRAADRLDKEHRQRDQLVAELERARRPQINTPLLPLERERRGELTLPASPVWVVLSLDLGGAASAPTYGATLVSVRGTRLWTSTGLTPNRFGALVISLPSTLLRPGDLQIQVEALPSKGPPVPAARYTFRVTRGSSPG